MTISVGGFTPRGMCVRKEVITDPRALQPLREQIKSTLPWYRRIFWL